MHRPTMVRPRRATALVAVALAALTAACGGSDELTVDDVWARSNPNGLGAVYAVVTSPVDDELVAARVDASIAGAAEVHEVVDENGMMRMQEVTGVPLPAGEAVALAPGGYHIMLLDMPAVLATGATFDVTLVLASGTEVTVTAEVREASASGMDGDHTEMDVHGSGG